MIGVKSLLYSERTGKQFITTRFLVIAGLPIFPYQSYFIHNKMIGLDNYKIQLNRKNIIKNYTAVYLSFISFMLLIFNFFLDENLLLGHRINPYYYELSRLNWPLEVLEKILTLVCIDLSVYFMFIYASISKEGKTERILSIQNQFWNNQFPGRNLVPILAEFYEEEEQELIYNRLLVLIARPVIQISEEENRFLEYYSTEDQLDFYNLKLDNFISNEEYKTTDINYVS